MKIMIMNLNVGSGIEYVGNKIIEWVKEIYENITVYKDQTCISYTTDKLIEVNPDIIIINEYFPRIIQPVYYYKKYNPKTKILFVSHTWQRLSEQPFNEKTHLEDRLLYCFCREICDKIICLTKNDNKKDYIPEIQGKLIELYMPVSSSEYKIITPWRDRQKLFIQLGNLGPVRMAQSFIDKVKNTNVFIDCYGEDAEQRIKGIKNLILYPKIKQKDMSKVLNEYKYLIVPHDGLEVFFIAMLQAMMCGTIPLVMNDRMTKKFDYTWIDWAKGLYFGTNTADDLVKNLETATLDSQDYTEISNRISQEAMERYPENTIKNEIISFLKQSMV